jgi:hypothetical protein
MSDSYLDRWAANVSAWVTIGLLLGGTLSCEIPSLEHKFELLTTLGGLLGALFAILVMLAAEVAAHRNKAVSLSGLLTAFGVADWLFLTSRITLGEYLLMRRAWIVRHIQS